MNARWDRARAAKERAQAEAEEAWWNNAAGPDELDLAALDGLDFGDLDD